VRSLYFYPLSFDLKPQGLCISLAHLSCNCIFFIISNLAGQWITFWNLWTNKACPNIVFSSFSEYLSFQFQGSAGLILVSYTSSLISLISAFSIFKSENIHSSSLWKSIRSRLRSSFKLVLLHLTFSSRFPKHNPLVLLVTIFIGGFSQFTKRKTLFPLWSKSDYLILLYSTK
jgi:hypothetical protein